jgi:hypothetical protein
VKRVIAVITAILASLVFLAPAASAHGQRLTQGADYAEVHHGYNCDPGADGECYQYHRRLIVNDTECDGHPAIAQAVLGDGSTVQGQDYTGCEDGSQSGFYTGAGNNITKFRVCETTDGIGSTILGCTGWEVIDPFRHLITGV